MKKIKDTISAVESLGKILERIERNAYISCFDLKDMDSYIKQVKEGIKRIKIEAEPKNCVVAVIYDTNWNTRYYSGGNDRNFSILRVWNATETKKLGLVDKCKGYHYNFGDGWALNVELRKCSNSELKQYKKECNPYHSYQWMVDSILKFGKIDKDYIN